MPRVRPGLLRPIDKRELTQAAVRLKASIRDALAAHDATVILTHVSLMSSIAPPAAEETSPQDAEHIAAVLLERASPAPVAGPADRQALVADLNSAMRAVHELRTLQEWGHLTRRFTEEPTLDMLVSEIEYGDLSRRWPGELPQIVRLLDELFDGKG